jgi:hypothetical protein
MEGIDLMLETINNNNNNNNRTQNFSSHTLENREEKQLPTYEDIVKEEMPPPYDIAVQTNCEKLYF